MFSLAQQLIENIWELFLADPTAQTIGFMAFVMGVYAAFSLCDRRLKLFFVAQGILLTLHFIMLGAYGGAAASFVTALRTYLSLHQKARKLAPFFYGFFMISGFFAFQEFKDILPILAGLIATYGMFHLSGARLRFMLCGSTSLWLMHNILAGSIGPTLMEVFILSMHITRATRLYRNERSANNT